MLANMGACGGLIHRDVATRAELDYYVGKWLKPRYARFPLAYFAFHGERGAVRLGRDSVTLGELAALLNGSATERIVYFGSCSTLAASDEELQSFCRVSGARAVVGYVKDIDWLESAAFDFILLPQLLSSVRLGPLYNRLARDHGRFVSGLGLRIATANWATPQKIALDALSR